MTALSVILGQEKRDQCITDIRALFRRGGKYFMLDRLIVTGVIEAEICARLLFPLHFIS